VSSSFWESSREDLAADGDRASRLLALHPAAHARLGPRGLHELQPVLRRGLARRGDDLHGVAALQLIAERHDAAVDPRPGAVLPDFGMDPVGEVDDGGADREVQEIALRGEDEDLLREEVFLHRAEELLRILEVLLPLEHLPEPGEALPVVGTERAGLLVAPVGRDAVLGHPVHLAGADLDLDPLAVRADDRRV